MRYLISVIDDGRAEAAGDNYSATPAEEAAIDLFNARLQAEGLQPKIEVRPFL